MTEIKEIIKEWIDSWEHCKKCDYMYRIECNCKQNSKR